ncbi:hypothetical protein [Kocuria sp. cx-455]|uniref:hypothetical protein n=1 Tax=Kocuria sp. cx-455 TaxID=2771377 RepID=UPI003D70CA46
MSPRMMLTRGVTATALAIGLLAASLAPASAARTATYWTGGSYADCISWQRSMTSSWSRVSESCHRNGNGWAFSITYRY